MTNSGDWRMWATALRDAARAVRDQIDRDILVVLAGDCESRAAELEKAKAAALQESLATARSSAERERYIRQWRMKAEELRTAADSMTTPKACAGMRNAATAYDAMADQAEQALSGIPDEKPKAG